MQKSTGSRDSSCVPITVRMSASSAQSTQVETPHGSAGTPFSLNMNWRPPKSLLGISPGGGTYSVRPLVSLPPRWITRVTAANRTPSSNSPSSTFSPSQELPVTRQSGSSRRERLISARTLAACSADRRIAMTPSGHETRCSRRYFTFSAV